MSDRLIGGITSLLTGYLGSEGVQSRIEEREWLKQAKRQQEQDKIRRLAQAEFNRDETRKRAIEQSTTILNNASLSPDLNLTDDNITEIVDTISKLPDSTLQKIQQNQAAGSQTLHLSPVLDPTQQRPAGIPIQIEGQQHVLSFKGLVTPTSLTEGERGEQSFLFFSNYIHNNRPDDYSTLPKSSQRNVDANIILDFKEQNGHKYVQATRWMKGNNFKFLRAKNILASQAGLLEGVNRKDFQLSDESTPIYEMGEINITKGKGMGYLLSTPEGLKELKKLDLVTTVQDGSERNDAPIYRHVLKQGADEVVNENTDADTKSFLISLIHRNPSVMERYYQQVLIAAGGGNSVIEDISGPNVDQFNANEASLTQKSEVTSGNMDDVFMSLPIAIKRILQDPQKIEGINQAFEVRDTDIYPTKRDVVIHHLLPKLQGYAEVPDFRFSQDQIASILRYLLEGEIPIEEAPFIAGPGLAVRGLN